MTIAYKKAPPSRHTKRREGSFCCPSCQGVITTVLDSRPTDRGIRRRRVCGECDCRFTTTEAIDTDGQAIRRLDGVRLTIERLKAQIALIEKTLSHGD